MRIDIINDDPIEGFWKEKRNVVIAFWHGRQLMMPLVYRGNGASILISMHEDGEIISRTMRYFGFNSIRGSTSRRGTLALLKMINLSKNKNPQDLVITPDGPRGPRYTLQKGVIEIARLTRMPIFPLAFSASKKNSLIHGITF